MYKKMPTGSLKTHFNDLFATVETKMARPAMQSVETEFTLKAYLKWLSRPITEEDTAVERLREIVMARLGLHVYMHPQDKIGIIHCITDSIKMEFLNVLKDTETRLNQHWSIPFDFIPRNCKQEFLDKVKEEGYRVSKISPVNVLMKAAVENLYANAYTVYLDLSPIRDELLEWCSCLKQCESKSKNECSDGYNSDMDDIQDVMKVVSTYTENRTEAFKSIIMDFDLEDFYKRLSSPIHSTEEAYERLMTLMEMNKGAYVCKGQAASYLAFPTRDMRNSLYKFYGSNSEMLFNDSIFPCIFIPLDKDAFIKKCISLEYKFQLLMPTLPKLLTMTDLPEGVDTLEAYIVWFEIKPVQDSILTFEVNRSRQWIIN